MSELNKYCKKHENNYINNDFSQGCPECNLEQSVRIGGEALRNAMPTVKEAGERLNVLVRAAQKYKQNRV